MEHWSLEYQHVLKTLWGLVGEPGGTVLALPV